MHRIIVILLGLIGLALALTAQAAVENFRFERLWPQLPQPWYFKSPSAITLGMDGSVYIADTENYQIQKFTANGDFVQKWGTQGIAAGQFDKVYGITTAPDGSLYVADTGNHRIQQFTADGVFIRQWGEAGSGNGQFEYPKSIAVSSSNVVYVADMDNNRVQVFSTSGEFQTELRAAAGINLNKPTSIVVSPLNDIYLADSGNRRILVFSASGELLRSWDIELDDNNFVEGMAYDKTKNLLYVNNTSQSLVFTAQGKNMGGWAEGGVLPGQLSAATGIAISAQGRIYVTEPYGSNRIQVFDSNRKAIQQWQSFGFKDEQFFGPQGIAVDVDDNVYVADTQSQNVKMFDSQGVFKKAFDRPNSPICEGYGPQGIALAPNGQFYVTDVFAHCVHVFSAQGKYIQSWGGKGSANGQLHEPSSLAIAPDGQVFVVDSQNSRIQVFSATGEFIRIWGSRASTPFSEGQFLSPAGIAISPAGQVFVSDGEGEVTKDTYISNHRIQVFTAQGQFVRQFGAPGQGGGQFMFPSYMTFSSDGWLFVSDTGGEAYIENNRIQIFAPDGKFYASIGKKGTAEGLFSLPAGIAAHGQNLWVVDSANNRIQKFTVGNRQNTPQVNSHPWKAIILAGGGASEGNYTNLLWDSTQVLANKAYSALRAQGFQKDEIQYLTAGSLQMDLDNDGYFNDLITANLQNFADALTDWATDANNVVLYLIDHGGPGTFKVNSTEILGKEQLANWTKRLQAKIPGKVTIIIEACKSAGFFPAFVQNAVLRPVNMVASTSAEQPAVISNKGLNSFSYYFWSEVRSGAKLQQAFKTARQGMSAQDVLVNGNIQRQSAQLDSNSDGLFNEADITAEDYCLGNCITTAADEPEITDKMADAILQDENKLTLTMQVRSLDPLLNTWALLNRPDSRHNDTNQPITDLEKVDMSCTSSSAGNYQCQGEYDRFDIQGAYAATLYAQDINSRISLPMIVNITQKAGKVLPPPAPETRYLPESGELILEDVTVNGQHFFAKLKDQGEFHFKLQEYHALSATTENPSAQFEVATNRLTLPKILAAGQYYQSVLHASSDNVFTVDEVRLR